MSGSVRIRFISEGFRDILCSGGTQEIVTEQAETICARANGNNTRGGIGFQSSVKMANNGTRWVGLVRAPDRNAKIAEAEDKALSTAVF